MSETTTVDEKGRLVLPKKIREEARIRTNAILVAKASGVGRVELYDPAVLAAKARDIGARKLAGWREDNHEAASYLLRSMKGKNEAD